MKVSQLTSRVFTVGAATVLSRILGFFREMLQSRLIGAGVEQSAFTLAFALPNMARKIFGEGALTAAFVPIFKGEVATGDVEAARKLMRSVLSLLMLILSAAVLLALLSLEVFVDWLDHPSERVLLIARLVRILLPYMVFICGAAFGMGVLNALGRFIEGALMPALLNVLWIGALVGLWFCPGMTTASRITVVCWAILLGGLVQMLFLFHCMTRRGYRPRLTFAFFANPKTRLVWKNTAIAALGGGATQINYMLDQVLGQCAAPWAAGVIGFAERLMDLPLGVVGVAFGTVLLPTFAGHFARHDADGARRALRSSLVQMLAVMTLAALVLGFFAPLIVRLVYQGRAFDAVATVRVSRALVAYAFAIPFVGVQKCLVPYFQAQLDMKTPLRVTLATVALNAVLNVTAVMTLPQEWRHVGMAVSTSLCAAAGALLLTVRFWYNTKTHQERNER